MTLAQLSSYATPEVSDGEFIGDYQVVRVIGRGPTGTTYRVMSNALHKEFALKTLPFCEELSLSWWDRLEAQTTLMGKLTHPNVDRVINSGKWESFWFLVKDLAHDGEGTPTDLDQYRKSYGGQLSHYQTIHLAAQALEGLEYAHHYRDQLEQGVCHGNLKPSNLLITFSARPYTAKPFEVKLTDWQPFRVLDDQAITESWKSWQRSLHAFPDRLRERAMTQVLKAVYSAYDYQAPELTGAKSRPTEQSDLFSLGVILYECLTGQLPSGRFPMPTQLRPELPEVWDEIISGCLAYRADTRFQTASEVRIRLLAEMETLEAPPVPAAPASKERLSLTPPGMVYIPAGSFLVGHREGGDDALPQHDCSTEGFYLDRSPVTNAQFGRFVEETGYVTTAEKEEGAPIWLEGEWRVIPGINWRNPLGAKVPEDFSQHPVTQVSFADALAYCEWAGRRLPTEQEWEYAARGGRKDILFPWGNQITRAQANFSSESTTSVMEYQANGYGLYDMAGNVWEWTDSWYEAYPGNQRPNPHFGEKYRVVRGGAWMYDGAHCMVSYRNANEPGHCYPTLGFRTACDFNS